MTAGGFVLLFGGGEFLVRGAVAISRRLGISPLLVGLTVVAFCTSAPELVVSVKSALAGNPDIAVGNVVGSNICNVALILGLSALIKPVAVRRSAIMPDTVMMLISAAVLLVLGFTGSIVRWEGALMVAALVTYIIVQYRREMQSEATDQDWHAEEAEEFGKRLGLRGALAALVVGLVALVIGSDLLIDGAVGLAALFGVPNAVVGLTVVALGTSLPELATSAIAAIRGHSDVAVGNVVGSNTFNVLSILGITAVITPVAISPAMARFDIPLMLAVLVFAGVVLLTRGRFGRVMGAFMLAGYVAYVALLYVG